MSEEFLWTEKYRPRKIADTILPEDTKKVFQTFVNDGSIPNLLLVGGAGVGKTTVARAMLEEIGADYIVVNGSLEGRQIDTLRNLLLSYASTMSLSGGRKYVILDEADYMNAQSVQPALRNFMEEFSNNCGFILTANFKNKIIEPLHSRCSVVDFGIKKADNPKLMMQLFQRVLGILDKEQIPYDKDVVGKVVFKHFPDSRRVINELQRYSATGAIDTGILASVQDVSIKGLIAALKEKDFTTVRRWVGENTDVDQQDIFRKLYDFAEEFVKKSSVPPLVLILAEYQYKAAFVVDQEINLTACLVQLMIDMEWK